MSTSAEHQVESVLITESYGNLPIATETKWKCYCPKTAESRHPPTNDSRFPHPYAQEKILEDY